MIRRVISGGQTGADRGGLTGALVAMYEGWPGTLGGWAPKGFVAEDGVVPPDIARFMSEHESPDYAARTRANVEESDATFIFYASKLRVTRLPYGAGTQLTIRECIKLRVRCFMLNLSTSRLSMLDATTRWSFQFLAEVSPATMYGILASHSVQTLNVAGPRESHVPGLERATHLFVRDLLRDAR